MSDVWTGIAADEAAVVLELEVISDVEATEDTLTLTCENGQKVRVRAVDSSDPHPTLCYERAT